MNLVPGGEITLNESSTVHSGDVLNQVEEEDPLIAAQREREEEERALYEASDIQSYDGPDIRAFYADMKEIDRENEVNRILGAFKLNPFEALNLRFSATPEEIRRQYRKVSLAVHPDKCSHPRAKDAFELIGVAQKELLDDEKRDNVVRTLTVAKDQVLAEWRKSSKYDAATRLAATLNEQGKEGVQAAYETTDEFHEKWKLKSRDVLAKTEWRKRKFSKRIADEEERAKVDHKLQKEEAKVAVEREEAWEKSREERVGSWRDFMSKKKKSRGGTKAPKVKQLR